MAVRTARITALRRSGETQRDPEQATVTIEDEQEGTEDAVRCAECGHALARLVDACSEGGAHLHHLVNPAGIEFQVLCFSAAPGCRGSGEPTAAHSWFPPARWRLALCGGCSVHVGWLFVREVDAFAGLIADRIRISGGK